MNVLQMINKWLIAHNCDGLSNGKGCFCDYKELGYYCKDNPLEIFEQCKATIKRECTEDCCCEFHLELYVPPKKGEKKKNAGRIVSGKKRN